MFENVGMTLLYTKIDPWGNFASQASLNSKIKLQNHVACQILTGRPGSG